MALPYTAYLDESGTHDGSEVTVMAGVLARADQWRNFAKGFSKAKQKHGFRVFHTKKFKTRSGDFDGWSVEQQMRLMADLHDLTSSGLTDAVAVSLDNEDYQRYYRGEKRPAKGNLDSKYGLCFRACLYYLVLEVEKRKYRGKIPTLNIVLESGHVNAGGAEQIFTETKKLFSGLGGEMLGTIAFEDKDKSDPLMIADFLAHTSLMINRKSRAAGAPLPPSQQIPRGSTGITHLQSTPEALARMREGIEKRFGTPRRNRGRAHGR